MSDDSPTIPLADVLRAANELVSAGLIEDYALGDALAAIYYVEPFTTYDADIFFIPADEGLSAGIPAIYAYLRLKNPSERRDRVGLMPKTRNASNTSFWSSAIRIRLRR